MALAYPVAAPAASLPPSDMDRIEALRAALDHTLNVLLAHQKSGARIDSAHLSVSAIAARALREDDDAAAQQDDAQTAHALESLQFMPDDDPIPDALIPGHNIERARATGVLDLCDVPECPFCAPAGDPLCRFCGKPCGTAFTAHATCAERAGALPW